MRNGLRVEPVVSAVEIEFMDGFAVFVGKPLGKAAEEVADRPLQQQDVVSGVNQLVKIAFDGLVHGL